MLRDSKKWEACPLMQGDEVFQRLEVIAVDNGRKLVIVGESDSMYLNRKRTEPIDAKAWRFIEEGRKGEPRSLKTVLQDRYGHPFFEVIRRSENEWDFLPWVMTQQDLRFLVEGEMVTATQSAEVLEREKAIIKAAEKRDRWKIILWLVLLSIVFAVAGFYLLMIVWFIGTLFKEVL